jgi:hypothetical protein
MQDFASKWMHLFFCIRNKYYIIILAEILVES